MRKDEVDWKALAFVVAVAFLVGVGYSGSVWGGVIPAIVVGFIVWVLVEVDTDGPTYV